MAHQGALGAAFGNSTAGIIIVGGVEPGPDIPH